ncbi:MAG: efflux RND transporter periplasmic adaptor subunit [Myxococcota bacterium]
MRTLQGFAFVMLLGCGNAHGHEHTHEHGESHEHAHEHAGDDHDHDHGHGHDHERVVRITSWSERIELYAEHSPVDGDSVEVLVHLTDLSDFRPYPASLRWTIGDSSGAAESVSQGIYRATLPLPGAGVHDVTWTTEIGEITTQVSTSSATVEGDDTSISLTKEQQWRVRFGTAFVFRETIRPSAEVAGDLTTPPTGTAHVHAPVSGRILAGATALPRPGDEVRRGQVLAHLAPTPGSPEDATRAGLAVVDAQTRVESARAELERSQRLLAEQAVPERRVADAERSLRVAEASLRAARQAQALYAAARSGRGGGAWRITAPIDGIIDKVDVSPGEAVDTNELVFRIVDVSTLWVHADVPESWAARLVPQGDAAFQVVGADEWHSLRLQGDDANAALITVGRSVDPRTRTVPIVYELLGSPHASFRVGAGLNVAVPIGEATEALVVPRTALLDDDGRDLVVVQTGGEQFVERPVRVGERQGHRVAILDGLHIGDRVVTEGAGFVRLAGQANETVGHGHVH